MKPRRDVMCTYHDTLEHLIVALDAAVLKTLVEDLDGGLPVAGLEVLLRLLKSGVGRHVLALVAVCHRF